MDSKETLKYLESRIERLRGEISALKKVKDILDRYASRDRIEREVSLQLLDAELGIRNAQREHELLSGTNYWEV